MKRLLFAIMLFSLTLVSNAERIPLHQLAASNKSHAGGIRHSPPKLNEPPKVNVEGDNLMEVFISSEGRNSAII